MEGFQFPSGCFKADPTGVAQVLNGPMHPPSREPDQGTPGHRTDPDGGRLLGGSGRELRGSPCGMYSGDLEAAWPADLMRQRTAESGRGEPCQTALPCCPGRNGMRAETRGASQSRAKAQTSGLAA